MVADPKAAVGLQVVILVSHVPTFSAPIKTVQVVQQLLSPNYTVAVRIRNPVVYEQFYCRFAFLVTLSWLGTEGRLSFHNT